MLGLFYNIPFQKFGIFFPIFLLILTIIQTLVMKKIANNFIEITGPNNVGFNDFIQYPKTLIFAFISTGLVLTLTIISLTVFSSGVDIFDFEGLRFIMLDSDWEIMNYLGLPFFHFATITLGGYGMSNYEINDTSD